jgi:hypothetical protein
MGFPPLSTPLRILNYCVKFGRLGNCSHCRARLPVLYVANALQAGIATGEIDISSLLKKTSVSHDQVLMVLELLIRIVAQVNGITHDSWQCPHPKK